VNGADVRMVQGGSSLRFALKTAQRQRIARDFIGKKFEGDEPVQPGILGLIDHPHAAAAKFLDNAVVRDSLPDHVWRILRRRSWQVNERVTSQFGLRTAQTLTKRKTIRKTIKKIVILSGAKDPLFLGRKWTRGYFLSCRVASEPL